MSRYRLLCTLLDTCGSFYCKGKAGRRLDRFLAYFQRYLLAKLPLPLDVDFDVQVSRCYWLRRLMSHCILTDAACCRTGVQAARLPGIPATRHRRCLSADMCISGR